MVSKSIRVAVASLLSIFAATVFAQAASGFSDRKYQLSDRGYLVLSVPPGWRDQVRTPEAKMPPTITFNSTSGKAFNILVTPIWPLKKDAPAPSPEELKRSVSQAAEEARVQAVEKSIDAVELKGASVRGYYFQATDRAPKPGEFKFLTQGMFALGNLRVTFTVLTNDGQAEVISSALGMFRSARLATPQVRPDHLNTPRLVADAAGTTVWRWDQAEPFGVNVPDENPSALGVFDLPLRLPGQYYDKETGLAQNWHRDYDAATGRYSQSDPVGLIGGVNTYAYVESSPHSNTDPRGLTGPVATGRGGYLAGQALNALLNSALVRLTGLTLGGLVYEAVNGPTAINSVAEDPNATVPIGQTSTTTKLCPPDFPQKQLELIEVYRFILKGMAIGNPMVAMRAAYSRDALAHNARCPDPWKVPDPDKLPGGRLKN